MKLRVGYFGGQAVNAGLVRVLAQEGVWYGEITPATPLDQFSVLALTGRPGDDQRGFVKEYLKTGGAVIAFGEAASIIPGCSFLCRDLRYVVGSPNDVIAIGELIDLDTRCAVPAGANFLRDGLGRFSAFAGKRGGGSVVALPFPAELLLDDFPDVGTFASTRSFYAERSRLPFERVRRTGLSGIRKLVARSLEWLHSERGLPYVHAWYYPDGAPSAALFRIDTDYSAQQAIDALAALLDRRELHGTWFVDVKSQQQFLQRFAALRGHEIGLHCYEHETYADGPRNALNIRKGLEILHAAGFTPRGFAAPFGVWNPQLARVLAESGFAYSSEFMYDSDNLPHLPADGLGLTIPQIPVHPMSIGGLKRQGFTSEEIAGYLMSVVKRKFDSRDPLFFYHHPNDGNIPALERLFDLIAGWNVPRFTMGGFASWWNSRAEWLGSSMAAGESPEVTPSGLSVPEGAVSGLRLRIVSNGREFFASPGDSVSLDGVDWTSIPAPSSLPPDISRTRRWNPWVPLIRLENRIFK